MPLEITNVRPIYSVIQLLWTRLRLVQYRKLEQKTIDAAIIHEAAIGRINDEQLLKLRTLGLTEEEAEAVIIQNFLN